MTEPLACCVHAMYQKSQLNLHDKIIITAWNLARLASFFCRLPRISGPFVIMTGITGCRPPLAFAKELGADVVVDTLKEDSSTSTQMATGWTRPMMLLVRHQQSSKVLPLIKKRGRFILEWDFLPKNTSNWTPSPSSREKLSMWAVVRKIHLTGRLPFICHMDKGSHPNRQDDYQEIPIGRMAASL